MKTVSTLGFVLAAALAAPAAAFADSPFAAAHDDAGQVAEQAVAMTADGADGWGPGIAQDDTSYPAGPMNISSDVRVADATRPGHDDTSYPADDRPAAESPTRVAAAKR